MPGSIADPDIDDSTAAELFLLSLPDEAWDAYYAEHKAGLSTGSMYTDEDGTVRWTDPEFDRQVQEMIAKANQE